MAGRVGAVKDRVTGTFGRQRQRRPWLDHLARAYQRYKATNGDHLAAAITYFSFLSLFPLILLGVSIAGFVLANNPSLLQELQELIRDNIPGDFGIKLSESVESLVANRGTIGLIGLGGVALAGLGWIGNLRTALQLVWSCEKAPENVVKAKLGDLLVLIGLGLGILASVTLTAGGTAAADQLIEWLGLKGVVGMGTLTTLLGLALALAADTLIFAWLFVRLPRRPVRYRTVLRGALFAAAGYELLKVVATVYLTRVTSNSTYGPFASAIGLLIWIDLVSRFLLLAAAWTATGQQPAGAPEAETPEAGPPGAAEAGAAAGVADRTFGRRAVPGRGGADGRVPAAEGDGRREGTPSPVAVAGVLVGTGAALGAGATAVGQRYLRRRR